MPIRVLPPTDVIKRLYWEDGLSTKEVAARFNVTTNAIRSSLVRAGVSLRSKADATRLYIRKSLRKKQPVMVPLSDVLRCSTCGWVWDRKHNSILIACPRCGKAKDARKRHGTRRFKELISWNRTHSEERRESNRRRYRSIRHSALLMIGKGDIRCVGCGCEEERLLEINHVNGRGTEDLKERGWRFYWDIVHKRRAIEDLDIRCKICNWLHFLEMKFGKLSYRIYYDNP